MKGQGVIDHILHFRPQGTLLKAITSTSMVKTGKSRKRTVAAVHGTPSQALIAELLEMAFGGMAGPHPGFPWHFWQVYRDSLGNI